MPDKSPTLEGTVLLQLRHQSGWTQRRLERTAALSRGTISLYETGTRPLGRPLLNRLALTLGHSVEIVDRNLAAFAQVSAIQTSEAAATPASLRPHERSAVEAAAGRAARRAAEVVRVEASARLVHERLRRERLEATGLWEELQLLPTHEARRSRVAGDSRYTSWALCERLCDESIRAGAEDAGEAHALANLAVTVAENGPGCSAWRCRLQSYAWAVVGNSLRVGGRLSEADRAFERSGEFMEAGGTDITSPLDESLPLGCEATLRCQQGLFLRSMELHGQALAAAPSESERARIFLSRSLTQMCLDRFAEALGSLALASDWIEPNGKPRWRCSLRFRRILNLCHLGLFNQAYSELGELRSLALGLGLALDEIRLRWLESRVMAGLDRLSEAAEGLNGVRQEFARRGITFDEALAALELAELELRRGNLAAVKALSRSTTSIFEAQDIPHRLLESLHLFWEAADREAATTTVAHNLVREFERAGARMRSAR